MQQYLDYRLYNGSTLHGLILYSIMIEQLVTPRLTMQILDDKDAAFIRNLVNTEGWIKFIGDRKIHSDDEAINYIHRIKNTPDFTYWVVRLRETMVPIGIISFLKRIYLDHFDIGFAFLPEFNGQGYAYEAALEVMTKLRKQRGHTTILATTISANASSIKLLGKLGFHFEKEIQLENEKIDVYINEELQN